MAEAKTEIIPYFTYPGLKVFRTTINLTLLLKVYRKECLDVVRDVLCEHYGITSKAFHSTFRDSPIPLCKQLFCHLCKDRLFPTVSSTALGKYIREASSEKGKYDHSTVLHGVSIVKDFLETGHVEHEIYNDLVYKITLKLNELWQLYQSAAKQDQGKILLVK